MQLNLNEDRVRRWLEALRLGNYEQGANYLHQITPMPDSHHLWCCLGVACNVMNPDGWSEPVKRYHSTDQLSFRADEESPPKLDFPPVALWEWLGFPKRLRHEAPLPFVHINDTRDWRPDLKADAHQVVGGIERLDAKLAAMNDSGFFTFNDIADFIEFLLLGEGRRFLDYRDAEDNEP